MLIFEKHIHISTPETLACPREQINYFAIKSKYYFYQAKPQILCNIRSGVEPQYLQKLINAKIN